MTVLQSAPVACAFATLLTLGPISALQGCYAASDEDAVCPDVEAAYEEARELHGCASLPETLDACAGLSCSDLQFDVERAAGREWRATPADLVRVFGSTRSCEELAADVAPLCTD